MRALADRANVLFYDRARPWEIDRRAIARRIIVETFRASLNSEANMQPKQILEAVTKQIRNHKGQRVPLTPEEKQAWADATYHTPTGTMPPETDWFLIFDLWESGEPIDAIATRTNLPAWYLASRLPPQHDPRGSS